MEQGELGDYLARINELPVSAQREILKLLEKLDEAKTKESSRKDFLAYVKTVWPSFIAGRHHRIMADAFNDIVTGKKKRVIINMAPRHALAVDTPIPTPTGFKRIVDLRAGDYVFGPDGKPTMVLGRSEVYRDSPVWRVSTDDGASVLADGDHLWPVIMHRKPVKRRHAGPKTTAYLAGHKTGEGRRPRLPIASAVEYPWAALSVPPYLLGAWLGDGTTLQAIITSHDDDQPHMRGRIEAAGVVTTDQKTKFTFGLLDVKTKLRDLGVLGNKHIPRAYLEASIDQRMELLRGLMDTDGNVSQDGQCVFSTTLPVLRDNVLELIRSLGRKASYCVCRAKIGDVDYGDFYRLTFYMAGCATLPRKAELARDSKRCRDRYLSFEPAGTADVCCIKVAREDGLFLCGEGYILTHNTKSEFASYLLPSYYLGHYPSRKIIQCSNTAELAVGFGRKVRNLIDSEPYNAVFDKVALSADSKAAGRWSTNKGGEYFAIGVGGTVTGKGADLLIIDDPHSEQEARLAANSPQAFDSVMEWYTSGPRQRLQPGGAIVIVMTRWSLRDLTGRILKDALERSGDEWELIELPAILPSGEPMWPEFWSLKELEALKSELPVGKWMAQYQQNPVSEEGAIIKREWWNRWTKRDPPDCRFTIASLDTAYRKTNRSDYSAYTLWGVFDFPNESGVYVPQLMLLDAWQQRLEFPELKKKAFEIWMDRKPDSFIVEAKAAGDPLLQELRAMGIPVSEVSVGRGRAGQANDKIARVNSISDIFASKVVWAPETRWAEEVIEQFAGFPGGCEHDDLVDSSTQAITRYREGRFISLNSDEDWGDVSKLRRGDYY